MCSKANTYVYNDLPLCKAPPYRPGWAGRLPCEDTLYDHNQTDSRCRLSVKRLDTGDGLRSLRSEQVCLWSSGLISRSYVLWLYQGNVFLYGSLILSLCNLKIITGVSAKLVFLLRVKRHLSQHQQLYPITHCRIHNPQSNSPAMDSRSKKIYYSCSNPKIPTMGSRDFTPFLCQTTRRQVQQPQQHPQTPSPP